MLTLFLIDGKEIKIKHYDYYHNNKLIGFTTEDDKRGFIGTKFIKVIK